MDVLEYRQKFEVELQAQFLTLLTLKSQENWFLAWRVCVRKSLSVDILRISWPIGMKISVYVAVGLESRTSRSQYNWTNISHNLGRGGGDFSQFFEPLYLEN